MKESEISTEFVDTFGEEPQFLVRAPGRVNLLGEHVDYNGGLVLPVAIDRSVQIAAKVSNERVVSLAAPDLGKRASFRIDGLDEKIDIDGQPLERWAHYPAGVAWVLHNAGYPVSGLQAVYTSNVPIGAGLSSSAAVEIGFGMLWNDIGGFAIDRMRLAQLCQRAEKDYVGVACGLMDQFASAHGKKGYALYFDTRSLDWEPVPLPREMDIVITDSGVRRSLTESAYNERRRSCEQAVKLLRQFKPELRTLRDITPNEYAAYNFSLPPVVRQRGEHVVKEIARVASAVNALRRDESESFGALMYAGHASLRDLYEVSTPELDILVEAARDLPGCFGARLTGAGFGGCTVNLVHTSEANAFIDGLQKAYLKRSGKQAQVYLCHASDGAVVEIC